MSRQTSILAVVAIVIIILFDAAQQKYYVDTYDLAPNGLIITFGNLFLNHLIRWSIWLIISLPFFYIIKNRLSHHAPNQLSELAILILLVSTPILISLITISTYSLWDQGIEWNTSSFTDFFIFFTFQKGLTFCITSFLVVVLIVGILRQKNLEAQQIEITHLQSTKEELIHALSGQRTPHLSVKTGYKEQPIPLSEIIWIQADDYCVKIHTKKQSFTLRQSMKELEQKLAHYQFARIHRAAILNVDYLDRINHQKSLVRLTNQSEIPFSKKGIKFLQEKLKSSAL